MAAMKAIAIKRLAHRSFLSPKQATGERSLAEVSNATLKLLVETMAEGGLAAKTIVSYSLVVKMVVASAVDANGDQIYPRKWNHDFVGMPIG